MVLNAKDLVRQQKKKDKEKNVIYQKVYDRIEKKISMASAQNFYKCLYEIPEFMLGLPLYNLNECINYVDKKLKENGFKTLWKTNEVLIDWSVN